MLLGLVKCRPNSPKGPTLTKQCNIPHESNTLSQARQSPLSLTFTKQSDIPHILRHTHEPNKPPTSQTLTTIPVFIQQPDTHQRVLHSIPLLPSVLPDICQQGRIPPPRHLAGCLAPRGSELRKYWAALHPACWPACRTV